MLPPLVAALLLALATRCGSGRSPRATGAIPRPATAVPATLRPWQSGDPVRWLQLRLREHGFAVPLSARFDPRTTAAVTAFKAAKLLGPLPAVDSATWAALLDGPSEGPLDAITVPPAVSPQPSTSP